MYFGGFCELQKPPFLTEKQMTAIIIENNCLRKGPMVKNKTFFQSVACAVKGLVHALKTEKNYRYYLAITLFFLIMNIILGVEFVCYLFQIVTTLGVFACECVNTAIEHLCDKMTSDIDPAIRLAKDIGAGAVLCWGIAFLVLEFIFIGRALL